MVIGTKVMLEISPVLSVMETVFGCVDASAGPEPVSGADIVVLLGRAQLLPASGAAMLVFAGGGIEALSGRGQRSLWCSQKTAALFRLHPPTSLAISVFVLMRMDNHSRSGWLRSSMRRVSCAIGCPVAFSHRATMKARAERVKATEVADGCCPHLPWVAHTVNLLIRINLHERVAHSGRVAQSTLHRPKIIKSGAPFKDEQRP